MVLETDPSSERGEEEVELFSTDQMWEESSNKEISAQVSR